MMVLLGRDLTGCLATNPSRDRRPWSPAMPHRSRCRRIPGGRGVVQPGRCGGVVAEREALILQEQLRAFLLALEKGRRSPRQQRTSRRPGVQPSFDS